MITRKGQRLGSILVDPEPAPKPEVKPAKKAEPKTESKTDSVKKSEPAKTEKESEHGDD